MKQEYLIGMTAISTVVAIASAAYSYISGKKVEKLNETIEKKVDGISDNLGIDIPDAIIEAAVNKAVEKIFEEYAVTVKIDSEERENE